MKPNVYRNYLVFGLFLSLISTGLAQTASETRPRARDLGIKIGILPAGANNSITDVAGVTVGQTTIVKGENIRTGVTAILPHGGNLFREKVPGAVFVGNGFGKLAGSTQVNELGEIETPILLTSTLSVPKTADLLLDYILALPGNESVRSINPLVAETNDGGLNDGRGRHITRDDVFNAIKNAKGGAVEEGSVGAGTGTVAFGWKGGIGTASRKLPANLGGYTLGVLVQSNFGGVLTIDGVPVGKELGQYYLKNAVSMQKPARQQGRDPLTNDALTDVRASASDPSTADGSIIIIIATDAPLDHRQLKRIASRSMVGLGRTGASMTNGSGDYAIAFSTANRIDASQAVRDLKVLGNDAMSPLFQAVIEATEESIINSLLKAATVTGNGRTVEALPIDKLKEILRKYGRTEK
ncbi:MAG: P1 family peptidase [Acidobacteria bacterium]|nr:P1 family peptidase [Acidobacteriota bacterium]